MSETNQGTTPATEETPQKQPGRIVWEIDMTNRSWMKNIPEPVQELINNVAARERKAAEERVGGSTAAEREEARIEREKRLAAERKLAETEGRWQDVIKADKEAAKQREAEIASQLEQERAERTRIYQHAKGQLSEQIRAEAVAAGARDESLMELTKLLGDRLDLDPKTLSVVVLGDDGQPSAETVKGLVTAYLQAHPHHLGRPKGTPGRATGGMSLGGRTLNTADAQRDAAFQRLSEAPTLGNVAGAVGAMRARKAS